MKVEMVERARAQLWVHLLSSVDERFRDDGPQMIRYERHCDLARVVRGGSRDVSHLIIA